CTTTAATGSWRSTTSSSSTVGPRAGPTCSAIPGTSTTVLQTSATARSRARWPDVDFTPSASAVQFGEEERELIAHVFTDDVRQRVHDTGTMHDWDLHRAMAAKGWIEQALPEALGGGGRDPEELAVLFRELELAGAPYDGLSICTMVASVIAHVGNN